MKLKELKKFGLSFGLGMALLTALSLWRGWPLGLWITTGTLSVLHVSLALLQPRFLKPTFTVIHGIGSFISLILTSIVFTLVYLLLFTPIALILKAAGKDQIKHFNSGSSWEDVPDADNNPERVGKLF